MQMMSESISASEITSVFTKAKSQTNSRYSFAHFANCTSDLSAGTCRRLPMMGDPLGPGGSGYFDFEPSEYKPAASSTSITTPPKTAKPQLSFRLRRASASKLMTPAGEKNFSTDPYFTSKLELCYDIPELYAYLQQSVLRSPMHGD